MARHRNGLFRGINIVDVDVDSPTFKRFPEDLIGDVALTHDLLLNTNGITVGDTVNHSGAGRGCPLGLPLVNQFLKADLTLFTPSAKDTHGGTGDTIIAPFVVFVPAGEDTLNIAAIGTFHDRLADMAQPHVQLLDTSMNILQDVPLGVFEYSASTSLKATLEGVPAGLNIILLCLRTDLLPTASDIVVGFLRNVSIHHGRKRAQLVARSGDGENAGVWTPSATQGVAHRDFDAAFFGETQPISGYEMVGVNRNINGLEEFITGWPAGGNGAYVHEDQDSGGAPDAVNPARSRFDAHTRSLYTTEPEIQFPVWAATFGAHLRSGKFIVEDAQPPSYGMTEFHAPWPKVTTLTEIVKSYCLLPDFQTSTSRLKLATFCGSDADPDVGDWTIYCKTGAGSGAGANPVAIDGSNKWWLAQESGIDFQPDALQQVSITTERTGPKTGIAEINILAACLYFEP